MSVLAETDEGPTARAVHDLDEDGASARIRRLLDLAGLGDDVVLRRCAYAHRCTAVLKAKGMSASEAHRRRLSIAGFPDLRRGTTDDEDAAVRQQRGGVLPVCLDERACRLRRGVQPF